MLRKNFRTGKTKLNFNQFEKVKKDTAEAAVKLTAYKKVIKDLKAQMSSGGGDDTVAKRLKNAEKEAAKLQNTVEKGRVRMSNLSRSLEKAGQNSQSFAQSQQHLESQLRKSNESLKNKKKG